MEKKKGDRERKGGEKEKENQKKRKKTRKKRKREGEGEEKISFVVVLLGKRRQRIYRYIVRLSYASSSYVV